MNAMMHKWSKKKKGALFAILAFVISSILVPIFKDDIRDFFIHTRNKTVPVAAAAPPANNIFGNNVAGSGNVVGNNNNVTTPAPVIVAPGSIGITGGNVTNPTVNNFGTTEWHLSNAQKVALGVFADSLPDEAAQFVVVGDLPDRQSQTYASDLFNVLAAHHRVNRRGHILSMAGEFPTGVSVAVHDTGANFETAQRIVSEMREEGIPVGDISTSDRINNHEIHLIVGLMPTTYH